MARRSSQLQVWLLASAASLFSACPKAPDHLVFDEPIRVAVEGNGRDVPSFELVLAVAHGSPPDALVQPLTSLVSQALKACAEADDLGPHAVRGELTFTGERSATLLPTGPARYEVCLAEKAKALASEVKSGSIAAARFEARIPNRAAAKADAGGGP